MLWFLASVPIDSATEHNPAGIAGSILLFLVSLIMWNGMFVVQPNQAEVVILFGHYLGSVKRDGWYYTNPLVNLASQYPYDDGQHPGEPSLRGSADEVAATLQRELQARLDLAGLEVIEARLSHLAYSSEIAGAMLQRQQATAIIAARQKIVEGAVSMVEMALEMLAEKQVVNLTPEKKADLVSSLLVVLTSERGAHPMLPVTSKHG